ncbi:MAG: O-antigen ligase family protein [Candidatus Wildermuthbacteria bacterium]|nr:O-antigen ligase family protein [Candidatus Wildermuthbacteria bacterium]
MPIHRIFLGLCLLILVLPLLNIPPWFSPPEWGKSITFRIIFSLILLFSLSEMLGEKRLQLIERIRQKVSSAKLGVMLLGGIASAFLLSSVFSLDPNFSFWGNPARGGGSITFLLLIAASFLAFVFFSKKSWSWAWTAVLITAVLVSATAVFQWQGWLSNVFIHRIARPQGTLGNDIQLGIYLLLLIFPAFVFMLQEKKYIRKILYLCAVLLFLLVIALTGSRGAYLGISLALFYFTLFYPFKKLSYSLIAKFSFLALMLIPAFTVYYVNTHRTFPQFVQKNATLYAIAERFRLQQFLVEEPRFSTWKVGWEAIKAKPLFGYGPENFEIGFDKHYDPKFPNIQYLPQSSNSWWDRAHNILVDTASQAGIPALFLYLALFGTLFWRLQKIKKGESALPAHGLQAALIAYLGANFFGFDNFSTLLVFFFLVAYILHVTSKEPAIQQEKPLAESLQNRMKIPTLIAASILILGFNWQYSIQPFRINTDVQMAKAMVKANGCSPAFSRMEKALKKGSTFLDAYVKVTYFDALRNCQTDPSKTLEISKKSYTLLKEAVKVWPYHTRTWIFLGQVATIVAERDTELSPEEKESVIKEAHSYFERAKELSPKHQEVYLAWTKLFMIQKDYEGMLKKAEECIDIYPKTGECWFLKGLARGFLGNDKELRKDLEIGKSLGYNPDKDYYALSNLLQIYAATKDLGQIVNTYHKLIALRPSTQLYASLAFTYRELGEYAKARETALKVMELDPSTKAEVEAFLRELP